MNATLPARPSRAPSLRHYRMLEGGEQIWRGRAYDSEHAEEKCFADEIPGSIPVFTLQRWDGQKWVTIYSMRFPA